MVVSDPPVTVPLKLMVEPEQMLLALAVAVTTGPGLTVVVMLLDVAGDPVAQVAFEVITTVTICPLVNAVVVYVLLFVPTFEPFTRH
jgi:hypothetical protein